MNSCKMGTRESTEAGVLRVIWEADRAGGDGELRGGGEDGAEVGRLVRS